MRCTKLANTDGSPATVRSSKAGRLVMTDRICSVDDFANRARRTVPILCCAHPLRVELSDIHSVGPIIDTGSSRNPGKVALLNSRRSENDLDACVSSAASLFIIVAFTAAIDMSLLCAPISKSSKKKKTNERSKRWKNTSLLKRVLPIVGVKPPTTLGVLGMFGLLLYSAQNTSYTRVGAYLVVSENAIMLESF